VVIEDSGALPYIIMARVEAAVCRLRPETTVLCSLTSTQRRVRRLAATAAPHAPLPAGQYAQVLH